MDVRDGFIVGIFNYCDGWCEACAFTARCRVFADAARHEAANDPNMAALVHAPLLPQDEPPPPPKWLEELLEEAEALVAHQAAPEVDEWVGPQLMPEHEPIFARARAYGHWTFDWLGLRQESRDDLHDPVTVIAWFASLTASKIFRALTGLAEFDGDRSYPPDHEGSAKVALIGIDRSQAAWRQLVVDGRVAAPVAETCVAELEWIKTNLEQAIPYARAFVRPGLDEPAAVSELDIKN